MAVRTPTAEWIAEEVANSVTHGLGLLLSVAGLVALVVLAAARGGTLHVVSCAVYGATLVALYAASTVYHSFREPRLKHLFRIIDHSAIYLLIAGTYTPFMLVNLGGGWGWTLLALIWTLALVGIVYKALFFGRFPRLATAGYVLMGWLAVVAIDPILSSVPSHGVAWMAAGGLFYTAGVWFYVRDRFRYCHAVWHLFVLAGSVCHYLAVLVSVIPAGT